MGGLSGQVALSGPGGCLEQARQTDGVTLQSPQAWLGATKSQDPPNVCPPTATPIRFLPIKRPVFLLGKPCQQRSLGKGVGVASGGRVSLQTRPAHKVNEMCAPGRGQLGPAGARHPPWVRHTLYGAPNSGTKTSILM